MGLTAGALIMGGAGVLRGASWARTAYLAAVGLLLYTCIVSPGYFAQRGEVAFVAMFAAFAVLALVAARQVLPVDARPYQGETARHESERSDRGGSA